MAKILSPGQRKRKIVRNISIGIFLIFTLVGAFLLGKLESVTHGWVDHHAAAQATVTLTESETESYRNLKGRKRERTIYYVTYNFIADGDVYENTVEVDRSEYSALQQGSEIEVWFDPDLPYDSDTRENIEAIMAMNNPAGHAVSAAPYSGAAALFIYNVLAFVFARESKKALPDGFYTQRSWLDVDDKVIVVADGGDIVYFDIHKHCVDDIQRAYQQGASLDEFIALNKKEEVKRIPMAKVTGMRSDHNSDTIRLEYEDEWHSIEFLNVAVKEHALLRFKLMIPDELAYQKIERTRLKAAMPSVFWLVGVSALFLYLDIFLVKAVLALIAVLYIVPSVIKQIWNPTQTEAWLPDKDTNESEATA